MIAVSSIFLDNRICCCNALRRCTTDDLDVNNTADDNDVHDGHTDNADMHDNDDDDYHAGNDDMQHDDDDQQADTHDSYDDTTQPSTADSPIQPPARPRRPRGGGRGGKRRETTRLIDEAKRLGIVKEEEEVSLVSGRPKRNRTAPLEWWKGDKYEYAMDEDGIGNLMPIVKSVVRSAPTPEVKKKQKGGRKQGGGKAHKVNQATNSHLSSHIPAASCTACQQRAHAQQQKY